MASFKGTSTDREYTVGQSYSMGGQSWTAQSDGSFSNSKTGQSLVGSSQEMADDKYRDKSDTAYILGEIKAGRMEYIPPARDATTGPGSSAAVMGSGNPGSGPGVSTVVTRRASSGAISLGGAFAPEKVTDLYAGGNRLAIDRKTSDGADWEDRWGEWGGALAGLGVMFNDMAHMADVRNGGIIRNDRIQQDAANLPGLLTEGAIDFARYLDDRRTEPTRRETDSGEWYRTGGGF